MLQSFHKKEPIGKNIQKPVLNNNQSDYTIAVAYLRKLGNEIVSVGDSSCIFDFLLGDVRSAVSYVIGDGGAE